jgi:hypothetical protein
MASWHQSIQEAGSADDLLAAARDFLATLTPDELGAVPHELRAIRIKGLDDLAYWQARLVEEYCSGGALRGDEAPVVSRLLAWFSLALARSAQIAHAGPEDPVPGIFSDNSLPKLFRDHGAGIQHR